MITRKSALQILVGMSAMFQGRAQTTPITPAKPMPAPTEPVKVTNVFTVQLADATDVGGVGITSFRVVYNNESVTITAADMFAALKATK